MKNNRKLSRLALSAALGLAAYGTAIDTRAQTVNSGVSIGPSEALAPPGQPTAPAPEHLFGDPGGIRAKLGNYGVNIILDWTAEVAGNVTGGVKQGATYAGQIGFEADIDWQKLAGIPGLSTHTVIVNRQGTNVGTLFGDNLNQVQEIYGAGGDVALHLVYTYAQESLAGGRVDIAVGRMPVLNDFAASPLNCNFMNNSLCGNPKALPESDIGMSSYPDAVWGGRVRVRPTPNTYIQAGVYEVNQGLYSYKNFRSGFKFDGSQDSGVEVPVELAYEPVIGPQAMPGRYRVGFAYDSSTNVEYFSNLQSFLGQTRNTGHKNNYWALADQMIVRNGPGPIDGIILLAGYVHTDPSLSPYANQFFFGVLDRDFWPARPQDTIGFLFNYANVSGDLGKEQGFDQEFGLPFANGASGIQTHQEIIELNYDIYLGHGVNFEPDFQYYFRPNGQSNIKDAAVLGFKSHVNF